jgi:hypothetical protein
VPMVYAFTIISASAAGRWYATALSTGTSRATSLR